jgi:hypothetical protein
MGYGFLSITIWLITPEAHLPKPPRTGNALMITFRSFLKKRYQNRTIQTGDEEFIAGV